MYTKKLFERVSNVVCCLFQMYSIKPESPLPDAFVIVYSVTDRKSFGHAKNFLSQVECYLDHRAVILVGNKTDLARLRVVETDGEYALSKQSENMSQLRNSSHF